MRELFAGFADIPAMTFGGSIDAIVPVTSIGRFRVWSGEAVIRRAGRAERYGCERPCRENAREKG